MIITVTMNPAADKTVEIESLKRGGLNRIRKAEWDAGGKGINVSKTISELGMETTATGFQGGNTGREIEKYLGEKGIRSDFVAVDGETRTNTKVFEDNGMVTELNEPGPYITAAQKEELLKKLEGYAGEGVLFVLSGSLPMGIDTDIYARIIEMVHKKGAGVLLDADGEAFRKAVQYRPEIIKPNKEELAQYAGVPEFSSAIETAKAAEALTDAGIGMAAVSMGAEGAVFLEKGNRIFCPAIPVKACSTVGAGDAMAGALAYAWENGMGMEDKIRLCMAVSAGAVTTQGTKPPSKELAEALKSRAVFTFLD